MKSCLITLSLSLLLPNTASGELDVSSSLVRLEAQSDGESRFGTGFIVALDRNTVYVATASHVVAGSHTIHAMFPNARPSRSSRAEVLNMDVTGDLALLTVRTPRFLTRVLAISGPYSRTEPPGSSAIVWGFPRRASRPHPTDVTLTGLDGTHLVLTGAIQPGHSGSPVVQNDAVVGLVTKVRPDLSSEAIPAVTLSLALESWLSADLLPRSIVEFGTPTPDQLPGRIERDSQIIEDICKPAKHRRRIFRLRDQWNDGWRPLRLPPELPSATAVQLRDYAEARGTLEGLMIVGGPATDEMAARVVCGKLARGLDKVEKEFLK